MKMPIGLRTALIMLCSFLVVLSSGYASVPMAPKDLDIAAKSFSKATSGNAGLYIYRDSLGGRALPKLVSIDGRVGQTANEVWFYEEIVPGPNVLSTEPEFGDNTLDLQATAETRPSTQRSAAEPATARCDCSVA